MTRSVSYLESCRLAVALGVVLALVSCSHARSGGDTVVHHARDGDGEVWVLERGDLRLLRFERHGIDQSAVRMGDPAHLHFTYTRAMTAAFALRPDAERVLVVGLGGGTLPMYLRHHDKRAEIDVVEISPAVVEAATRWLGFLPDARMRVHVGDGRAFIAESLQKWDLIILDAYGAEAIPLSLTTREFLDAVKARLAPGGLVAANVWGESANHLYPSMLRTYEAVFGRVHVVRALGSASRIVLAPRAPLTFDGAAAIKAGGALKARWKPHFDLVEIITKGYEGPGGHPLGGVVLRDSPGG